MPRGLRLLLFVGFATTLPSVVTMTRMEGAQSQRSAFRVGIDLVSLSVTATDTSQRYVPDLAREDFVVTENGAPQVLTFFAKGNVPLALALLIDTSASMEQNLGSAQEAAIGFVRQIGAADLATIINFGSGVQIGQGLTSDQRALEDAIRRTAASGSTALYNAVYIALKELAKVPVDERQMPRRRALVVLSDGDDTSSLVSFDEVLDLASRSDTVIYAIGLGPSTLMMARSRENEGQLFCGDSPSRRADGRSSRNTSRNWDECMRTFARNSQVSTHWRTSRAAAGEMGNGDA